MMFLSCAESSINKKSSFYLDNNNIASGQTLEVKTNSIQNITDETNIFLVNDIKEKIEKYKFQINDEGLVINRVLNKKISLYNNYSLLVEDKTYQQLIPVNIQPSIIIESLCASKDCDTLSGNVLEGASNTLKVLSFKIKPVKFVYKITTPYQEINKINEYSSPVSNDWLDNILLQSIPVDVSFYIGVIQVTVYDVDNNKAESFLPFKVTRPLEVKHFGEHELAEVYEPIPVTGCIPGSVGNNVQYSESETETRQNSISISFDKSWSDSFSTNTSQSISEGISVSETKGTVNSSSISESETQSESFTDTNSESESNNVSFSTNDGESWSWSLDQSNSTSESESESSGNNTSVNGSTTVGVSGEGSLPFLAKASGKVEVSAGVSRGWNSSNTNSSSTTNGESRGYSTGGSLQEGRSFGSVQNDSRSHSLSGAYVLSSSASNSISESNSLSSGRVWNMSESLSSGMVATQGNSESISQTIVASNSSSTTFSYSGYIPRGRYGVFFRQTSRYVKMSEIITYNVDGFAQHAGYIMMNTWAWAPELSISNTCEEAMNSNLPKSKCLIDPCN